MKKKKHVISRRSSGQYWRRTGDWNREMCWWRSIGQTVEDVFDYRYLMNDEYIELLIEKAERRRYGNWRLKRITTKIWGSSLRMD